MTPRPDESGLSGGGKIIFRFIGIVRTRASDDEIRQASQEVKSAIEVFPEFQDALEGIDGYSSVIAVGRINEPLLAEKILEEGKADLIAMGRALLADPELPNKAYRGDFEDITPLHSLQPL